MYRLLRHYAIASFAAARERATISGGAFSAVFSRDGGVTLNASWAR